LIKNRLIKEIIDYKSEKIFKNADVYVCILIITKKEKEEFKYNNQIIQYKNLVNSIFQNNINKEDKLEKHIEISNGLATLRDKIYIHNDKKFEEPCWKKIFKVSKNKIRWIICPYDKNGIISENDFKKENPKTYDYLLENKEELSKRDNGNKKYEKWYSFGRTQGLKTLKYLGENVLYISTMCPKDFQVYEKPALLYYSGLIIRKKENSTLDLKTIKQIIINKREEIYNQSSKRGSDWFNLSSTVIKNLSIN
jgi:hypothetical protein